MFRLLRTCAVLLPLLALEACELTQAHLEDGCCLKLRESETLLKACARLSSSL